MKNIFESENEFIYQEGNDNYASIIKNEQIVIVLNDEKVKSILDYFNEFTSKESFNEYEDKKIPKRDIEKKNIKNHMSPQYFSNMIINSSFPHFSSFDQFLSNELNSDYLKTYRDICSTINYSYTGYKARDPKDYKIDKFLDLLIDRIINIKDKPISDSDTIVFVHYLYWKCDIGDNI